MKYIILKDTLHDFKQCIQDVLGIKVVNAKKGNTYNISKKLFYDRCSLMEDILGFGYRENIFNRHSVSSIKENNSLHYIDSYKFSFTEDHTCFILIFEKHKIVKLKETLDEQEQKPIFKYKLQVKVTTLEFVS